MANSLKIGSLNIQGGLRDKLLLPELCSLVRSFDIFVFLETWLCDNSKLYMEGYDYFRSDRQKNKRAKRGSGGVCTFVKRNILKGVEKIKSKNDDAMWIKLKKSFFNLEYDIYVCCCYLPPANSKILSKNNCDVHEILQREIMNYQHLGEMMIIGDLNCRTGGKQEQWVDITTDTLDRNIDCKYIDVPTRFCQDSKCNTYGTKLLDIMNECHLLIVNGRVPGDMLGSNTYHGYNGSSCIDLCICSNKLFESVKYFKVYENSWYTDHSPICISFKCNIIDNNGVSPNLLPLPNRYRWDERSKIEFNRMLNNEYVRSKISTIISNNDLDGDRAISKITKIIQQVADSTLKRLDTHIKNKKLYRWPKTAEPSKNKKIYRRMRYIFSKDTNNLTKRHEFFNAKKKYKKSIKLFKRQLKMSNLNKIANLEKNNPKEFWKCVNKILSGKNWEEQVIDPPDWINYFTSLLNTRAENSDIQFHDFVQSSLEHIERCAPTSSPMDIPITEQEFKTCIGKLKRGKSSGLDAITNDMILDGGNMLHDAILSTFNKILQSGSYPQIWQNNLILPIFKSGSKTDPQNYRGIALSNCIGKLFCLILNTRLESFLREHNTISINQNGFKKGHRTEDNVFVLQSLYNKYVKTKSNKLYVAFIDFSKYFVMINREFLYYKLIKNGITGKIYYIIKSMYNSCFYHVKCDTGITEEILSTSGMKQGCNLSPALSNLYQNDLHDIFDDTCDHVDLEGHKFNSLSWADDLVLISTSEKGLQNCLNRLHDYCFKWAICINPGKSTCMVMTKGKTKKFPKFHVRDHELNNSSSVKYLGFVITSNMNHSAMIEDRILKANRASYMLKQALSAQGSNVNVTLAMSLFDKMISPVLLYGCSIWGLPKNTNLLYLKNVSESEDTRSVTEKILHDIMGRNCEIRSTRRIGKINQNQQRPILVEFNELKDKFDILNCRSSIKSNFIIENFEYHIENTLYEKMHCRFLKFILNVNKYSSNSAVRGELGRFPLSVKVISLSIKYWHNIVTDKTPNIILKAALSSERVFSSMWLHGVEYTLTLNGLGYIWNNMHASSNKYVYKLVKERLQDQYLQTWSSNNPYADVGIQHGYTCNKYLHLLKSVNIRSIFTKLRIRNSILKTSNKTLHCGNIEMLCPMCENNTETLDHFILECTKYTEIRKSFMAEMNNFIDRFVYLSSSTKLSIILNICLENIKRNAQIDDYIKLIATFIKAIYTIRKNIN